MWNWNWVAETLKETILKRFIYGAKYRQSDIDEYLNIDEWQVLTYTGTDSVLNGSEDRAADENESVGIWLVHVCMPGGVMEDFSKSGHMGKMLQYPSDGFSLGFVCAVWAWYR